MLDVQHFLQPVYYIALLILYAPSSFQRPKDKIFQGLLFVTTYVDDILVHSVVVEEHSHHLLQHLADAGLTLRGTKCHIGMKEVSYLGHVFSSSGMAPDSKKIQVVQEWPVPTVVTQVRQFLGLASNYRRYIYVLSVLPWFELIHAHVQSW